MLRWPPLLGAGRWVAVICGLAALLCVAVSAGLAAADPTPLRRTLLDPPGWIRAEASLGTAVARVEEVWTEVAGDIAAGLEVDRPAPVEIVLLESETFARWSRGLLPEWGVGFANWPGGPIVLDVGTIARGRKSLAQILGHELSHVYLGQRLEGIRPPMWFVEGVAQAQSGEWRFSDTLGLVGAASTRRLPELNELHDRFPRGGQSAALAYRIAVRAVLELERRFPEQGGWRAVLGAVSRTGRFDLAFAQTYGLRAPVFEREVALRLRYRYGWIAALAGAGSLFSAMTLLFLVGYGRKRLQIRRRLREMEVEERHLDEAEPSATGGPPSV